MFRYNQNLLSNAVERTNMMYGDLNIKEERVIYVHGSVDPWHALGITTTRTKNTVAIYINGRKPIFTIYHDSTGSPVTFPISSRNLEQNF